MVIDAEVLHELVSRSMERGSFSARWAEVDLGGSEELERGGDPYGCTLRVGSVAAAVGVHVRLEESAVAAVGRAAAEPSFGGELPGRRWGHGEDGGGLAGGEFG